MNVTCTPERLRPAGHARIRALLAAATVAFTLAAGSAHASKILFVWEGAALGPDAGAASLGSRNEYLSLLTGAGHTVTELALTDFVGGVTQNLGTTDVISPVLDATFDQVWVMNLVGSAVPANLSANDLIALQNWSTANARDEWILDGLSWRGVFGTPRGNMNTDEENFTLNMAAELGAAGGGILVGADNEQAPLNDPADGSGTLVATVNQVLDQFGFNRFIGAYNTPAGSFEFGGSFFTGAGALPASPVNFSTSTGSYAEVPTGLQPNGRTLFTAVQGIGTPIPGFNSAVLPGNVNHVVSTTIRAAAINAPEPGTLLLLAVALVIAAGTGWHGRRTGHAARVPVSRRRAAGDRGR